MNLPENYRTLTRTQAEQIFNDATEKLGVYSVLLGSRMMTTRYSGYDVCSILDIKGTETFVRGFFVGCEDDALLELKDAWTALLRGDYERFLSNLTKMNLYMDNMLRQLGKTWPEPEKAPEPCPDPLEAEVVALFEEEAAVEPKHSKRVLSKGEEKYLEIANLI